MFRPSLRLARPVYEGLPWIYVTCGLASLTLSYLLASRLLSFAAGVFGILSVIAGVAVLLRRRDYRSLRLQYGNSDAFLRDVAAAAKGDDSRAASEPTRPGPRP